MKQDYTLIQVSTEDELILNGLYQAGEKQKAACLFVHGFTGDFYSQPFFHAIAGALREQGNALVLAQHRGTGLHTEFLKVGGGDAQLGSYYERLEDAHLDITALVKFLKEEGYEKIVLMGHSLGTIKIVRYLFEGAFRSSVEKLVLLAPFDKNAFIVRKAGARWDEFLKAAHKKIAAGKGEEVVRVPEYEDFPLSYQTFYSWYQKDDLSCMWDFYRTDYDFPVLHKIEVPVLAILGERDQFVTYPEFNETAETALSIMKKHLPHAETLHLLDCNHTFKGQEEAVASATAAFVS